MKKLSMYCMAINNSNFQKIKELGYIPVGLKNDDFSREWLRDNTLINISKKNPYYGEYTFYYWYWKNLLKLKKNNEWVGFCSYRRYWANTNDMKSQNLKDLVLQEAKNEWENFNTLIGKPISINEVKLIKVLKYGKTALFKNPKAIFSKMEIYKMAI